MTCEKIFAAVLITIIFTDLKSQVRNSSRTYRNPWDITQFVSRMQPIWTYNTTERTDKTCKVDVVRNIGTTFMEFNRSFDYHGHRENIPMQGRFDLYHRALVRVGRTLRNAANPCHCHCPMCGIPDTLPHLIDPRVPMASSRKHIALTERL
ncbi:uncharacterized protein LOC142588723 [Dermacentor variabilis]|uniref:uncharacterized protein LOC142588723 n=1 Tax=Dermacentor variabilis TaxID=34621 RepID=UPI003F5BED3E